MPIAQQRGTRSRVRLLLPRRKSWRLCYDGVEIVGIPRKKLRESTRTEGLMGYFRETRGWGGKSGLLDNALNFSALGAPKCMSPNALRTQICI